jgi:hypothetical protein
MSKKRRKFLIDRPVQLGMVFRMLGQWMAFLMAVVCALPLFRAIVLGDIATPLNERLHTAGVDSAIVLVVFLLLLPYFVYDSFKMTNRFAGPMYRLHQTIKSLAAGESATPLKFRDGDYWQEVAQDFNAMVERLGEEKSPEAAPEEEFASA